MDRMIKIHFSYEEMNGKGDRSWENVDLVILQFMELLPGGILEPGALLKRTGIILIFVFY